MDVCWLVPTSSKEIHSVGPFFTPTLILTPTFSEQPAAPARLVVWDTQTGVVIRKIYTDYPGKVMFHGDQRTITYIFNLKFYTYDALNGTQLCQGYIPSWGSGLGAHWVYKDALQFVTSIENNGKPVVNFYELQLTSTTPLHLLSSFPISFYQEEFSFSPVSFHASFVTSTEVIIVNVQDTKLLLQIEVAQVAPPPPVQFSPNGAFFACRVLEDEIWIWQNTPTGYIPWSSLRPRLSPLELSWSPTSTSILCQCMQGILLLHPGNHPSPLPPNRNKSNGNHEPHLVAYSTDSMSIAIARQRDSVITVLNCTSGTVEKFVNMDMQIQKIQIIDNTIFMISTHKLIGWDLKVAGVVDGVYDVTAAAVNETLAISTHACYPTLSYDCSCIAFAIEERVFLYDIKTQEILKSIKYNLSPTDIRFSPDGHHVWLCNIQSDNFYRLDIAGVWRSTDVEKKVGWTWNNPFSRRGYVGMDTGWVSDYQGRTLLWLPPNWRVHDQTRMQWKGNTLVQLPPIQRVHDLEGVQCEGNFMAFVGRHHPVPIIIKFQP